MNAYSYVCNDYSGVASAYFQPQFSDIKRAMRVRNSFYVAGWSMEWGNYTKALRLLERTIVTHLCMKSGFLSSNVKEDREIVEATLQYLGQQNDSCKQWFFHPSDKRDERQQKLLLQRLVTKGIFHTFAFPFRELKELAQTITPDMNKLKIINRKIQNLIEDEF
ncbi:MAG: hypothetical protein ACRDDZ_10830 [Marinifilaceae bacterium]